MNRLHGNAHTPQPGIKTTSRDDRRRIRRPVPRRAQFLFLLMEGERLMAGGARYSLAGVKEIVFRKALGREVTRERMEGGSRLIVRLPGRFVSREHARMRATPDGWIVEDAQSTNGLFVNGTRVNQSVVGPADLVEIGWTFFMVGEVGVSDDPVDVNDLDCEDGALAPVGLQTLVPELASDLRSLRAVIPSRLSINLVGEPGTGKEVLSRIIHAESRPDGPFVAVNCGAVPSTLLESELFGYARGAFSGAVGEKTGYVRAANHGTLLLDEIISAVPGLQEALLRVLQEGEVMPIGNARPVRVDVRFLAAGQRSLDDAVAAGTFRSDLRDRLKGYTFLLRPLRDRLVDIGLLTAHLLRKHSIDERQQPRIEPEAALKFLRHRWPGNIRELELVLQSSWALGTDGIITEARMHGIPDRSESTGTDKAELKQWLTESLRACGGNVSKAAEKMGRNRTLIHRWMREWDIHARDYRR